VGDRGRKSHRTGAEPEDEDGEAKPPPLRLLLLLPSSAVLLLLLLLLSARPLPPLLLRDGDVTRSHDAQYTGTRFLSR